MQHIKKFVALRRLLTGLEADFMNNSENISIEQSVEAGDTDVILDVNLPVWFRADSQEEYDANTNENNRNFLNQSDFNDAELSFDAFLTELVSKPATLPKPTSTKRECLKKLQF